MFSLKNHLIFNYNILLKFIFFSNKIAVFKTKQSPLLNICVFGVGMQMTYMKFI